jgi:hypothetical protein
MFEETLNVSMNPLPNHGSGSVLVNASRMPRKTKSTNGKIKVRRKQHEFLRDSNLKGCSRFSIHIIDEMPARAFVRRLAEGKVY